jgi:glutathione S-transferase
MKLVIAKPSPYARKARVALIEKRIPFETVIDAPWNPGTEAPSFNSLGKIPVLVLDDGRVVHDSKVIVEYLETLEQPPRLIPTDPLLRVAHKQIEATADGICDAVVLLVLERARAPGLQSTDWIARQLGKVKAGTKALAGELGGRQWFVGAELGLADIAVGCMLSRLAAARVRLAQPLSESRRLRRAHICPAIVRGDNYGAAANRRSRMSP